MPARASIALAVLTALAALAACRDGGEATLREGAVLPPTSAREPTVPRPEDPTEPAPEPAATAGAIEIGAEAPDFTLEDTEGKPFTLSAQRGKVVVLEWFNPDCPFVRQAHGEGALKGLAAAHLTKGDVGAWVAINSGAPGKQGHGLERNRKARAEYGMTYPVLLDEDGAVGRLYQAKTTPHMYVIDAAGKLAYRGAITNAPLGRAPEGRAVVDYVAAALSDLAAGKSVVISRSKPWGCSVKYAD